MYATDTSTEIKTIPFGLDFNAGQAGILVQKDNTGTVRHRYVKGGPYLYDSDTVIQLKCHVPYVLENED
jgi:hypothetical protein